MNPLSFPDDRFGLSNAETNDKQMMNYNGIFWYIFYLKKLMFP
jgi:hypothetical protein